MNRAERRLAARKNRTPGPGEHLTCGCHQQTVTPMNDPVCPDCGRKDQMMALGSFSFPTGQPAGTMTTLTGFCPCGGELSMTVYVEN